MRHVRLALLSAACLLVAGMATACGGTQGTRVPDRVIAVTERDFHISAPRAVRAGDVVLEVRNLGPESHELLIARVPRAGMPMRSDGLSVDEERLKQDEVGLEPGLAHDARALHVRLRPGRYLLYCNMSGHFLSGMRALMVVN
jgi:uncharacterized cupredoxin-like copper-binding protein